MVRGVLLLLLPILAVTPQSSTQEKSKQVFDCRKIVVQDSDRRSFNDLSSFTVDVDGDGRPDTITPRIYTVKANRRASGKTKSKTRETHWISFDRKTSKGRVLNSFFKYKYGTEEADYWAYALIPCNINKDRNPALLFYSGDDTSEETIILVDGGNVFRIYSRRVSSLGL